MSIHVISLDKVNIVYTLKQTNKHTKQKQKKPTMLEKVKLVGKVNK